MGAPKQKWTAEEEAALKAGVRKHGAGKWRTILKDPEFSRILYFRSNVDLKDKWRNMSIMPNGCGSKDKPKLSFKRSLAVSKHDGYSTALSASAESEEDIAETRPLAVPSGMLQIRTAPKRPAVRLDLAALIMEAIVSLKEPNGSNKTNIAAYIEDQYGELPDLKRLLSEKLKSLTASRKLVKVKRKYRIASPLSLLDRKRNPSVLPYERRQRFLPRVDKDDVDIPTKSEIEFELAKMRTMTSQEADAAAARAVAEAEAAIAEAEEAAREAEAAEADAAAAQAFADAAMKTMKSRSISKMVVQA